MNQQQFIGLLTAAVQHKVSDIHLHPGQPPAFRMNGDLVNVKHAPLTEADFEAILSTLFTGVRQKAAPDQIQEFDGSFEIKGVSRFRFNVFRLRGKLAAVLRIIPNNIPSIDSMGFPPVLKKIASMSRGLVLVTGATGSGKSTTLASMIDHINSSTPTHILTIEDPVEFIHPQKQARISQREVGQDTRCFADALRAALRQDPDVILVGEMRDAETIDIALKAAETGHLVFSTVHTTDAIRTIGRLVSVFPPAEQKMVRLRLADNLVASISQRLLKRADGKGLIAAQEIMVSNPGIAECISDPDMTYAIKDFMIKSAELTGAQTFDIHLSKLYLAGTVDLATAKEASSSPSDFERNLMYGGAPTPEGMGKTQPKADKQKTEKSGETPRNGTGPNSPPGAPPTSAPGEKPAAIKEVDYEPKTGEVVLDTPGDIIPSPPKKSA